MPLEKSVLRRQDGAFLGPTSLSWVTLAKNKLETALHMSPFSGRGAEIMRPPQAPSEKLENKKMCLHEDKSVNSTAERGCGCTHSKFY